MFQRSVLSPSSGLKLEMALKMEIACFSEMLPSTNHAAQQFNPKEYTQNKLKVFDNKVLRRIV
jgi:hypothetical protein